MRRLSFVEASVVGDGGDEGIVCCGSLGSDAEVPGSEAKEVGGVADEDAMLAGKVILELGGGAVGETAEHEVGLGRCHGDAGELKQRVA